MLGEFLTLRLLRTGLGVSFLAAERQLALRTLLSGVLISGIVDCVLIAG